MSVTTGTSIITYTGKRVWPTDLKIEDIDPIDIAHHLSCLSRYNGAVELPYFVSQHCCLVHDYGPDDPIIKAELLIHDGSEAYIGDLVAPLKCQPEFEFYREIEDDIQEKISYRFGIPYPWDSIVKELDLAIREAEIRDLKNGIGHANEELAHQFKKIIPWGHHAAKFEFMNRFRNLGLE